MKKQQAVAHAIVLFGLLSLILLITSSHILAAQKNRGAINVTLGVASGKNAQEGDLSLVKNVSWNLFSGWISAGFNLGIIKKEYMLGGSLSFNIPIKPIQPFTTAGYGVIFQNLNPITTYGVGVRISLGKSIGIVAEYRKFRFKNVDRHIHTNPILLLDYYGAGIFYYF